MKFFNKFLRKKEKDSTLLLAPEIPFRPHQCPNCNNYIRNIKRCEGFSQSAAVGKMLAMFSGESKEDCSRFEPEIKIDVLKSIESTDVKVLIKALHSNDSKVSSKAIAFIKEVGEPAVEPLISVLNSDKDSKVRYLAAITLGDIGDSKALEPLLNAIKKDPVRDVRWHAVDSLVKIGNEALAILNQLLNDGDSYIRDAAREAIKNNKILHLKKNDKQQTAYNN